MSTLKALLRSASTSLTSCGLLVAGGCVSAGLGGGLLLALLAGTYLGWVDVSFPTGSSSVGVSNTAGEVRVEYENAEEGKPRLSSYEGILPGFVDLGTTQASVDLNDNTIDGTVITPDGEVFDLKDVLPGLRVEPSVEGDGFVATLSDGGTEYRYGLTVEATAANDGDALTGGVRIDRLVTQDGETILEDSGEGTIEAEQEQVDGGTKPTPLVLPPAPVMADAGPPRSIAKNDSVMLEGEVHGGSDVSVLWTPSDGLSDPTALQPIASPETTTTYTLTATNEDGSRAIHSATVTVGPEVPLSCAERDCNDGIFCNGEETCTPVRCVSGSEGDECGCLFVFGDNPCGPGRTCDEADRSCDGASCTDESCNDDGLFCNGTESCNEEANTCVHSGDPCIAAGKTCDEAGKTCKDGPCTGDGECDDGRFCNGPEKCSAGECVPGTPPCDEATQTCDETIGRCVPIPGDCETLSGRISEDRTLTAGCYVVEADVSVNGTDTEPAKLTIQPGVTIEFQENTAMIIHTNGRLAAIGTEDEPILLTGQQEVPGYWDGLRFVDSDSIDNQIKFVTIEFAGGRDFGGGAAGNLVLDNYRVTDNTDPQLAISNCTFQGSAAWGIWIDNVANVRVFANNIMESNAEGAVSAYASTVGFLDADSDYQGNIEDRVRVIGNHIQADQTWAKINVPYVLTEDTAIKARLTISPGATLKFAENAGMVVHSDGILTAVGTAGEENTITLTGERREPGFWAGLRFVDSDFVENRLEHVVIEFGGGRDFGGGAAGNLVLDNYRVTDNANPQVTISDCTLQDSAGWGLWVDDVANVRVFANNLLTSNAEGAISMYASTAGFLDAASDYQGNHKDRVRVIGNRMQTDQTWAKLNVPYLLTGDTNVRADLAISAGATLEFETSAGMYIQSDGTLSAVGTASEGITLTIEAGDSGHWNGLRFIDSDSDRNRLDYVTIDHGGDLLTGGAAANLVLDNYRVTDHAVPRATITNCIFRNSAGWGVWVDDVAVLNAAVNPDVIPDVSSQLESANNTFENNASGAAFRRP